VSNAVLGTVSDYSRNLRSLVPANASWVDDRVGPDSDVPYLMGTSTDVFNESVGQWQLEFWNRSLNGVYAVGVPASGYLPQRQASFDRERGRISSDDTQFASARHVVAGPGFDLAARRVARDRDHILYEVEPPIAVASVTGGVFPDAWMGADASYDRYEGSSGELTIDLSRRAWPGPDKPGRVRIEIGPLDLGPDGPPRIAHVTSSRTWIIHAQASRTFRLETPKPPFRAFVHIEPTFSPADYGQPDARQLGAQVAFGFKPAR
jgi:hypothetical protein